MLDVRDVMQTVAGRATDRLQPQDQDAVAGLLGLDDRDALLKDIAWEMYAVARPGSKPPAVVANAK